MTIGFSITSDLKFRVSGPITEQRKGNQRNPRLRSTLIYKFLKLVRENDLVQDRVNL